MATEYAKIEDVEILFRTLTEAEKTKATALLPIVCSRLNAEAKKVGKDLDMIVAQDGDMAMIAKQITVDIVARVLMTPTAGDMAPLSQYSQSGMGYTVSGTFLSPGGGMFIKNAELEALGLKRPKYRMIEFQIGDDDRCSCME